MINVICFVHAEIKEEEEKKKKMGEQMKTSSSSSLKCNVNDKVNNSVTLWEIIVASGVVFGFGIGLSIVYLTMPVSDYSFLKLPRTLQDLRILR